MRRTNQGLVTPTGGAGGTPAISVTGPDAFGDPAVIGTDTNYARQDHDHGLPASPAVPAAGATVVGPDAYGAVAAVGISTDYSRKDHDHGLPASPTIPVGGTPAIVLGTAAAAGVSPNFLRRDDTIVAFDATVPVTQAFSDAAAAGTAVVTARRDHKHGMPASPAVSLTTVVAVPAANVVLVAGTVTTIASVALTTGTWLVSANCQFDNAVSRCSAYIANAADTTLVAEGNVVGVANVMVVSLSPQVLVLGGNETFILKAKAIGTPTVKKVGVDGGAPATYITAVKIA